MPPTASSGGSSSTAARTPLVAAGDRVALTDRTDRAGAPRVLDEAAMRQKELSDGLLAATDDEGGEADAPERD